MGNNPTGGQKARQTLINKFRQPGDTDDQAYQRYRDHMKSIGKKVGQTSDSRKRGAQTKLKQDPDYFKKLQARRKDRGKNV